MNAESHPPPPLTQDVALFLDFDGTLVDIAPAPDAVIVPAWLPEQLRQTAWLLNGALAVVSGRAIKTIDQYLGRSVQSVAGIHGAERRTPLDHIVRSELSANSLQPFRTELAALSNLHPGVLIEDKEVSIAVHFREAPDAADACRRAVEACAAASHGTYERLDGKMVVELKPVGITKVAALCAYMNEAPFAGRRPVFVGDDVTDESAFVEVSKTNGFGVIVGTRQPTAASARLTSVAALHLWLAALSE